MKTEFLYNGFVVEKHKVTGEYINDYIVPLIKRKAIKKLRDLVKVL